MTANFSEVYARQVAELQAVYKNELEAPLLEKILGLEEIISRQELLIIDTAVRMVHSCGRTMAEAETIYNRI